LRWGTIIGLSGIGLSGIGVSGIAIFYSP
jgi:hypothetical protein